MLKAWARTSTAQRCSLSRGLPTQPGVMEEGLHCGIVQGFWSWAEVRKAPERSEICPQDCAGNQVILTLATNTDSPSLETEALVCYHGQKGLHPEEFSVFCPLLEASLHPFLCFHFVMPPFLQAVACSELQTLPEAHTKECPFGVERIIKMLCFSSRPMFISKAALCECLCVSIGSCSVPTGTCPK